MLEGLVAQVLNAVLGKYVEEFDSESLNVGIFSGDVCLRDLKLKPSCLVHFLYLIHLLTLLQLLASIN